MIVEALYNIAAVSSFSFLLLDAWSQRAKSISTIGTEAELWKFTQTYDRFVPLILQSQINQSIKLINHWWLLKLGTVQSKKFAPCAQMWRKS